MKRILLKIAACLCILFVVINCIWFLYWHSYNRYKNAVGYDETSGYYMTVDLDGYRYVVFAPDYLRFVGNLTIGNTVWGENDGNITCSLIIWPLFNGSYEFGIMLYIPVEYEEEYAIESYSFVLDGNGTPISEELSEEEIQLLKDNADIIKLVYQKAYDMWGIGSEE